MKQYSQGPSDRHHNYQTARQRCLTGLIMSEPAGFLAFKLDKDAALRIDGINGIQQALGLLII